MEKYILTLEQDDSRSTKIVWGRGQPYNQSYPCSTQRAVLEWLHTVSTCISLTIVFLDQEDQEKQSGADH